MDVKNLRTMVVSADQATDVRDTSMLKPGARRTASQSATNVIKQYETGSVPHGPGHDGAQNAGV